MKAIKTKKRVVKLVEIGFDDWLFIRSLVARLVSQPNNLQDVSDAAILSELFLEKNNSPYAEQCKESLKLNIYQILALSRLFHRDDYPYYSFIGIELFDIVCRTLPRQVLLSI
jgi:hypothetical protein